MPQELLAPGVGGAKGDSLVLRTHLCLDLGRVVALGELQVRAHRRDGTHVGPLGELVVVPTAECGQAPSHGVGVGGQPLGLGHRDHEWPERLQRLGVHPHRVQVLAERRRAAPTPKRAVRFVGSTWSRARDVSPMLAGDQLR